MLLLPDSEKCSGLTKLLYMYVYAMDISRDIPSAEFDGVCARIAAVWGGVETHTSKSDLRTAACVVVLGAH